MAASAASAVWVFASWGASRSTPCPARNTLVSAAAWNACRGLGLRRELEDPVAVGQEPQLGDHPARGALRGELALEQVHRSQHPEVGELDVVGQPGVQQVALVVVEQVGDAWSPASSRLHLAVGDLRGQGARAGEARGGGVHLDLEAREAHAARRARRRGASGAASRSRRRGLRWVRRARTTRPAADSRRSGVSTNATWRITASSCRSRADPTTRRAGSASGTVSFSSTESTSGRSASTAASWSASYVGSVVMVASGWSWVMVAPRVGAARLTRAGWGQNHPGACERGRVQIAATHAARSSRPRRTR